MTTKPRVKKFRLRRSEPAPQAEPPAEEAQAAAPAEPVAPEPAGEDDLAAIRREGLTGRQLRMARRVAHKHGLAVTSDFDAVRQLRQKGVDPFQRATMLELAVSDGTAVEGAEITPSSVMMPAISSAGVTSNAGLYTSTPSGAVWLPKPCVTSAASRSSMGISSPVGVYGSMVDRGAAT